MRCSRRTRRSPAGSRRAACVALLLGVAATGTACADAPLRVEGTGVLTATPTAAPKTLPSAALRNIRNLDLRSAILADSRVPVQIRQVMDACATCGLDNPVYIDFTGDKIDDVLVPVYSEAEQIGSVAFTVQNGKVVLAFANYGPHSTLDVVDGALELALPVYLKGDPACCPSGEPTIKTYRWNGSSFRLLRTSGPTTSADPAGVPEPIVVNP